MMQLTKITNLNDFKRENKKIEFIYKGWEEPNRGQELVYYALLIDGIDKTKELFSENAIQCVINEKIETEHPSKNFAFIPNRDFLLLNTLDFTKTSLKVYFREDGYTFQDSLVGSFFYPENHLLINKRSLVLTDLRTLENKKIKFDEDVNIEWAFLINSTQLQVIQAFSNSCFVYDLEEQKIIEKRNIVNESLYSNIFRWIYRGQKYQSNQLQLELIQKKENKSISTYFKND
ncbi:hypothetical protein [Flavobacterium sp. KACC 22763]|uniref:hypothetical protein n=1 Tax=Flavobacterium sp. KACC 22763 TaxID=3025668 RepID=UPI0023663097|nr:hypothetical protein [Flavobacterium sp. KACC 22763]WDF65031.1 hypothetical protein PQ463_02505 [Flavobacterium sp. KACC 22763]